MIISFIGIIVAFALLIKSADFFVAGASSIARKMGITPFVVGLTVVAVGTSAPEVVVNIIAALHGETAFSIGNIVGSNVVDILLGLGVAALFAPLVIKKQTVWKEIPFALLSALVLLFVGADLLFDAHNAMSVITRGDGLILLSFFVIFIIYTFGLSQTPEDDQNDIVVFSWMRSIFYTIGGIGGLVIGGKLAVMAAVAIAQGLGMSANLIGLTIVAAGTSLPEIVTAIVAVRKGQTDLVVGGIIGTIIFNVLFALGLTALVAPLPFAMPNIVDNFFLIFVNVILFIIMFVGRKHTLYRWEGIFFIMLYIAYMTFAIIRG